MAGAIVQSIGNTSVGAASPLTLVFGSNVTNGNLIVVVVYCYDEDKVGAAQVSDTRSNSYSFITGTLDDDASNTYTRAFYAPVGSTGACTISLTPVTTEYLAAVAWELSGVETSSPVDDASVATGTGTSVNSGSVSTSQDTVLLGCMTQTSDFADPGVTMTPGASYTQDREHEASSNNIPYNDCHRTTNPGSGTYSVDWTLGSSQTWLATAVAVKESSGGGGTVPVLAHRYRQMQGVG